MRLLTAVLLTSIISFSTFGQTYTVSTFAGSQLGPHNIPGISAGLGPVRGVAVDAAGNVFMSLYLYNSVVRLDATTRILTLVAGNGTYGFSGDNGPATSAQLFAPRGIAVDKAGNLYIADSLNHRVRKVSGGVITTVAGNGASGFSGDNGPATNAELNDPLDVTVDSTANVYIADTNNGRIRKVSGGLITTVAGNGTCCFSGDGGEAANAQLSVPSGIAVDSVGNIYIADTGNLRIRKVANGTIITLAGNGTPGFGGDNGPANSAQFGAYFSYDEDPNTYTVGPTGVAVDFAGNVYIADTNNNRIRKVSNGVITTMAGTGSAGFTGDGGEAAKSPLLEPYSVAVDSAGNLYIADTFNYRLRKVSNGVIATLAGDGELRFGGDNGPAGGAQLYEPYGVAVDSAGNVYIADTLNNRVRKVSNGIITTVAGDGTPGFSGDGGPATSAQLSTPIGLAVDSAGNLYIADVNNYRIRKVSNGVITTVPGTIGFTPYAVAVDPAGALYIATGRILKVSNGVVSTPVGNAFGSSIAVDADGDIYFADSNILGRASGLIRKFSNGVITTVAGGNAVTVDGAGNVYISDEALNLIRKISGGVITVVPVSPALSVRSRQIAADSAGHIYCEDASFTQILVLTQTGSAAPSSVFVDTVTNGASNLPLPIAPGEIVILTGSGLGPVQLVSAHPRSDGFYDTQLAGTSVLFNGIPAPILYTSATQVAAVVPYAVTGAGAQLTVTYQGQAAPPPTVAVADSAPGLFTADSTGNGQAAAVNENGSINSASTPASIGSVISLFATGEGQTSPRGSDGKPATAPFPTPNLSISVTIGGGQNAQTISGKQLQYVGGAPGEVAGVMQINVRIPAGITPGSAVPIFIIVGNGTSQQVTIAVSGN